MKLMKLIVSLVLALSSLVLIPNLQTSNAIVGWVGAAGSPYDGSAASQPVDINVSNNAGISSRSSVAVNSQGQPCIAWMDSTAGTADIFYTRWNGTNWVNASGAAMTLANSNVSNNSGGSTYPQLKLDSSDNPCISWTDSTPGNTEIYFARWNGSSWVTANGTVLDTTNGNVSNDTNTSQSSTLALDASGNPHIAWCNWMTTNYEIIYTKWNGSAWVNASGTAMTVSNSNVSNDTENNYSPSLDLDSTGIPWIGWYNTTVGNYEIMLGRWNGSSWVSTTGAPLTVASGNISNNTGISFEPCVKINSSNRPCVAWYDNTPGNNEIYFARWNGTNWVTANGSLLGATNANVSNSSGDANLPRLALDSSDNPHIVWYDDTMSPGVNDIYYVRWNGSAWVNSAGLAATTANSNVSNTSTRSYFAALALDSSDNPHIVWDQFSPTVSDIYYITWAVNFDGSFALAKSVDTNNDGIFNDTGMTVNAGDTLTYKINWQFNQGQDPLENPYLYDTVPDGTTYVAGSASPNANISYSLDGGATWTAGEPPNGSPAGTQLRWDLSSLWVGAAGSPYIGSAATQPMDINMSRNAGISQYSSIELDSKGNPNIAWRDNTTGNNEVFFVRWNGQNWVNINDVIYDPLSSNANVSNSSYNTVIPSLKLDKNDNPHITWGEDSYFTGVSEIVYVHWNGSNWLTANNIIYNPVSGNANISQHAGVSGNPQLELDSNNYPHITWNDFSYAVDREICYICWNGSNWVTVNGSIYNPITGNCNVSQNVSGSYVPVLDVDSNNRPHIAWHDRYTGTDEMFYVYSDGNNWRVSSGVLYNPSNGNANISNNPGWSQYATLLIDSNDNPHISWIDTSYGNGEVLYTRLNGTNWLCADGSLYNPVTGNANVTKTTTDPYPFSVGHSMAIDKNNNPHISWTDVNASNNLDVYYIHWNNGQWFNDQGNIYIPSPNNANTTKSPSSSINSGHVLSIVTDSNDLPHMVFWDNYLGNLDILYIHLLGNSRDFSFSVRVDNPPTIPAFCNKATFRHKWDNGKAIESNEICNTIDYNFTGTYTLDKGVDANGDGTYADSGATVDPGATISYKIDWSFDNPNNDPLFNAYVYDTVPLGTTYVSGTAPTYNLSYSINGGATWIAGEPPNGAPAGTRLRWKLSQPGWTNAKGQLVNSTNPNVSNNAGISDFPSLAINKNGDPCITWSDDVSGVTLVYYARWNGSQWVNAAGLPFTVANGSTAGIRGGDPTLALDPVTGNPWIAFQSNAILFTNLEIHILKWDGSQWTNSAGTPATLLNTNVSNNTGLSWYPSHQLALDSNRFPCFVWKDNTTGSWQNYFARWNGANWTNVSGAVLTPTNASIGNGIVDPSFWPTLVLDGNDNPCIAWDSNITGNSEVYYAKWDGTAWVTASGSPLTPSNGNVSNNTGASMIPYLAMDRLTGNPCMVWSDNTPGNYEIYFAKWNGSAWVNANGNVLNATNANMSLTSGISSLLSIAMDSSNLPAVTWEDDTTGNSEIYYAKWNGANWTNSKGVALTSSNGIINVSPLRSWFPSLAFNPVTNSPNIAWLDRTPGSNEVYFARWTDFEQSFTFSVKVDKPFDYPSLSPICNTATFTHVFDRGLAISSNSACVKIKGLETKKNPILTISKTSRSFEYNAKDTFDFTITVKNTGDAKAADVVMSDLFPKELEFVSSMPSGLAGRSTIKFQLGDFNPGRVEVIKLKFRLNPKLTVQDCIMVTNEAIATSGDITVKDSAVFKICAPKAPCPLYFDTKWTGLDKNLGKANTQITGTIKPECGSSPYTVTIDWGDGTKSTGTIENSIEEFRAEHTYTSIGDFTVRVTVKDAYLSSRTVEKKIKILQ